MRDIQFVETKEKNFTICVDKIYLHSKYYPLKEAKKFIDANDKIYKNKRQVVVYGIGIGYHIKEILNRVDKQCKVYVFDVDKDIVNIAMKYKILKELKNDKRIELFLNNDYEFLSNFKEKLQLVDDILIYQPSLKVLPEEYKEIKEILQSYVIGKIAINKYGNISLENYKSNIKSIRNMFNIQKYFQKYNLKDKPVVIAAGGPSLEYSLKFLKVNREKLYIFSLGRTIDILMQYGIKPDNITIIHSEEVVYEQIKEYIDLDIPLLFLSTACNKAVKSYRGPKYIFFNKKDENNESNIIINTGKTVAVASLDIAVKSGVKTVIFIGQDLAFLNNKAHAGDRENTLNSNKIRKVLSVDGRLLDTTLGMLEFKRNIEMIIKDNSDIRFINCSKGAKIKGTKEINLEEVLNLL
ncbi:motility associated factor glycosyltransferase family protein [Clostridium sporogenes]|uniref:motility associated factor glycosyltransferase family protein n=1 Tax=Clostridium sporogenes TaxID=1509 RepID=UPI0013CB96B3|nr:6-hydroxymethylpterin diphosphokinase MptE-like protein [Clostridium sporogenes]NFQ00892.1 motility associated factor glycosyltransferase family protein [Clostridium sporogenes]NFQ40955.1 motility associated factor glycosyltransferase family protein [Clostridium sporogenes]